MAMNKVWGRIEERLERIEAILEDMAKEASDPNNVEVDSDQLAQMLDYDTYTATEVIDRVDSLTLTQRRKLLDYERQNKARKTVIEALKQ